MKVSELMKKPVRTCRAHEALNSVASQMWDGDLGCVPVVDEEGKPIAMVTDRDISMAAFLTGEPLHRIPAKSAASQDIYTVRDDDDVESALQMMRSHRVRRLPVVDERGRLVGMLSSADVVRNSEDSGGKTIPKSQVTWTLAGITQPRNIPAIVRTQTMHA